MKKLILVFLLFNARSAFADVYETQSGIAYTCSAKALSPTAHCTKESESAVVTANWNFSEGAYQLPGGEFLTRATAFTLAATELPRPPRCIVCSSSLNACNYELVQGSKCTSGFPVFGGEGSCPSLSKQLARHKKSKGCN